jgi:saccharopine dehydrogenase (NAD+, L-lysine forming)
VARIGIRREDKSRWEARSPLVPDDVKRLVREYGLEITVQTSPHRAFSDDAYRAAGAQVSDTLADCPVILGVKEVPPELFEPAKTYVFFSHTIKGQPANMPALRRLMELGCQLIDYERIVDEQGRRRVLFGPFAGQAGMIDTLYALGRRLQSEGLATPFADAQPAHRYTDLAHARNELTAIGERIRREGLPETLRPFVCGFTGYGAVSKGAQEIYDYLPVEEVPPEKIGTIPPSAHVCYKVVFKEEHMVARTDASKPFQLQEYYERPERYGPAFFPYVKHLTLLMNCIYWAPKYPRLATCAQLADLYAKGQPHLRVIGDISCDINGAIECTTHSTTPDNPVYVYEPATGLTRDGVEGHGPVILAVDFLPCELPFDSSVFFSRALSPYVPALGNADFSGPFVDCGLPPDLRRATIVYRGKLTEAYHYLSQHVG